MVYSQHQPTYMYLAHGVPTTPTYLSSTWCTYDARLLTNLQPILYPNHLPTSLVYTCNSLGNMNSWSLYNGFKLLVEYIGKFYNKNTNTNMLASDYYTLDSVDNISDHVPYTCS